MTTMNIYDMADTWNAGGTTFTAIKMNVTDTASAAGSLLLDLQVGGASVFRVAKSGIARFVDRASGRDLQIEVSTTGAFHRFFSGNTSAGFQFENNATVLGTFSSSTGLGIGSGADLFLIRDAANTLAQRNSTNAQAFRIYNTYTDASNYERLGVLWSSNDLRIQTEKAGSGTARSIIFGTDASARWLIGGTTGHFLAGADNTYDIGASGANRPRNVYAAGSVFVAGQINSSGGPIYAGSGNAIGWNSRSAMTSGADGHITLYNAAINDFNRLQFGGTTSSFPALKRSTTEILVRLADDSDFGGFQAGNTDINGAVRATGRVHACHTTAIPAGGTAGLGFRLSSTSNFGVFFGSGAPTLSAAKGSLYLRSDGSTTNDRMYVNTDGATTWTAVTTAA